MALNESDLLVVEERARRLRVPQERGWEAVGGECCQRGGGGPVGPDGGKDDWPGGLKDYGTRYHQLVP